MPPSASLLATITDPWESLTQALRDNDTATFGDPQQPGTPAFHLHHTAVIFRLHARKLMHAVAPGTEDMLPSYEAPLPVEGDWSPASVMQELTTHAQLFADWLDNLAPGTLDRTTLHHSKREQTASEFLDMMTRHIVWHAAATYYRARPLA